MKMQRRWEERRWDKREKKVKDTISLDETLQNTLANFIYFVVHLMRQTRTTEILFFIHYH